jgi:alpha-2-macroglobulin-like protein
MRTLIVILWVMTSYFGYAQNTIEKIYVQTDKPLYIPGEDLWFKVFLVNNKNYLLPLSDKLYYELMGPSGNSIVKSTLDINEKTFGVVPLEKNIPGGIYELKVHTEWNILKSDQIYFSKKIQVQKYISPALLMSVKTDKEMYHPNDIVNATVKIRSLDDKPLYKVPYKYTLYQNGIDLITDTGFSDEAGQVQINVEIPKHIKREDCLLNVIFTYRGNQESVSKSIPIISDALDVQFLPEGGSLLVGYNNTVALKSIDKNGKPADVKGEILDQSGNIICNFSTFHDGMGKFNFTPIANTKYYAAIKSNATSQLIDLPKAKLSGAKIEVTNQNNKEVSIKMLSSKVDKIDVSIWKLNQKVFSTKKHLKVGMDELDFNTKDFVAGVYKVQINNQDSSILSERLVFVNNENKMQVKIESSKEKYNLRDQVEVKLTTTDHKGKPVAAEISVSVVNDKLITLADDKQDNILSSLLMSNELIGKVHHPSFYFSNEEKATKALDLVMMTHGWRNYLLNDDNQKYADYFMTRNVYVGRIVNNKGIGLKRDILIHNHYESKAKIISSDSDGYFYIRPNQKASYTFIAIGKKNEYAYFKTIKDLNKPYIYSKLLTKNNDAVLEIITKYDSESETEASKIIDDLVMESSAEFLNEVVVTAYKVPLIEIDNTTQGSVVTSESITNLGTKSINGIVGNTPGSLPTIRGARSNETIFYIDGIRTSGTIPFLDTQSDFYLHNEFNPSDKQAYYGYYNNNNNQGNAIQKEFYVPVYFDHEDVDTRTDFRSTIYWNPVIQTDSLGIANFTFPTSDEITTFKIIAEGISATGLIGREEHTFAATKMLNISCKSPKYFVLGDTVQYNMIVNNELDTLVDVQCKVELSSGLKLLKEGSKYFSIPALSSQSIELKFLVNSLEAGEVVFSASSNAFKDKVMLNFDVLNPFYLNTKSIVVDRNIDTIIAFPLAVQGSIKGEWNIIKDPIGTAMNGVSSLLRSPSGCFEQVSSTTFPNIMVLQYMKDTGNKDVVAQKTAHDYIKDGYKRLINYETTEGGFDYWGGSKANLRLTAYGLLEFFEMKKVYAGVDQKLIDRTKEFLIKRLNKDGCFSDDSYGDKDVVNAYILYALSIVDAQSFSKIKIAYDKMIVNTNDPYLLALMTMAAYHFDQKNDYEKLNSKLINYVNTTSKKKINAKETLVIAYSNDNNTETTALITQALLVNKKNIHYAAKCISHILTKYTNGHFGSTQATCLSLQSFIRYAAVKGSVDDVDYQFTSGSDTLLVNNKNMVLSSNITNFIKDGKIGLSLKNKLNDTVVSSLDFVWLSRKIRDAENSLLGMRTKLSTNHIALGAMVNLEISFTNKDANSMIHHPTALIGIPSGLTLNMNLLNDLVEKKEIASFEIFNNYVCLYLSTMKPSEIKKINIPLKAEIEGSFQGPASTAYLYYDNGNKVYNDGLKVWIKGRDVVVE